MKACIVALSVVTLLLFCIGESNYRELQRLRNENNTLAASLTSASDQLLLLRKSYAALKQSTSDYSLEQQVTDLNTKLQDMKADRDSAIAYYQQQLRIADAANERLLKQLSDK